MEILNVTQGSPEWHAARASHFCASDAPAMLGLSKYTSRNDFLNAKKTGVSEDITPAKQALFNRGHEAEAAGRVNAEKIVCGPLYPCVCVLEVDGLPLLASLDGIDDCDEIIFEHKLFAQWLANYITKNNDLPPTHCPQVEHQLLVSGAKRCLFMVSDEENEAHIFYESKPDRRAAVLNGWKQFAKDLADYVPQEHAPEVIAATIESLPAVFVKVDGQVSIRDNLPGYKSKLEEFIGKLNLKPKTDQEFADLEAAAKKLRDAEKAIDKAKESVLTQVETVGRVTALLDEMRELANTMAIAAEKAVKAEKENRKLEKVQKTKAAFDDFMRAFDVRDYMPPQPVDFGLSIKGLKTLESMQNSLDTALANAKIAANEVAAKIRTNLSTIDAHPENAQLFADRRSLVQRDAEFVVMTVKARIADHLAVIAKRDEERRARMQAEADAKAKAEAERVIEAERAKVRAEERAMAAEEASKAEDARKAEEAVREAAREAADPVTQPEQVRQTPNIPAPDPNIAPAPANITPEPADDSAEISLGQINTALKLVSVSAAQLTEMGFNHRTDRASKKYKASDLRKICAAIIKHLEGV